MGVIETHKGTFTGGSVIIAANCVLMGAYFMGILGLLNSTFLMDLDILIKMISHDNITFSLRYTLLY